MLAMDLLGIVWVPNILLYTTVLAAALYIYSIYPFGKLAKYGYSGPRPKPFTGNFDLVFRTGHAGSWYLTGKKLYGKVFAMYEGRRPTLVVFDLDVIKHVMVKDFSAFENRQDMVFRGPIMRHSLLDLKGAAWKRVRALSSPFFSTMKLKQNVSILDYCVRNLLARCDGLADSGEQFDAKEISGAFTLEAICLTAFGVQIDSQSNPDHVLLKTVKRIMAVSIDYWGFRVAFTFPVFVPLLERLGCEVWPKGSMDVLRQLTREIIQERKTGKGEERADFIQAMIKAHEMELELEAAGATADEARRWKSLTEDEICAQAALFILAGYDTTATALSFLLFNLANNAECQEKLLDEIRDVIGEDEVTYEKLKSMTYLDMCVDESLRMYPSVLRTARKCNRDITINGYFFPKGTNVMIPIHGLQNDPDIWHEPDKFNPERFSAENLSAIDPFAYQVFGQGPRKCIGLRLALIEVKMAIIKILQKYRVKIGSRTNLPIKLTGVFAKVEGGIWLQVEKRVELNSRWHEC